jgi:hypothetical protein
MDGALSPMQAQRQHSGCTSAGEALGTNWPKAASVEHSGLLNAWAAGRQTGVFAECGENW